MGQLNFPGEMLYESGRWGVKIDGAYRDMFENILSHAAPLTTQALIDATEEVYEDAFKNWPVSPRMKIRGVWGPRWEYRNGERFRHSRDQLIRGVKIISGGAEVVGFVRNMAPWSWAVVWGERTATLGRRLGAKVGRDLILKPGKKLGPKIAQVLADELARAGVK